MQVFGATDASTADAEQAAEENLQLTSGRRDAWDRQQAQVAFQLHDRLEQLRGTVGPGPQFRSVFQRGTMAA